MTYIIDYHNLECRFQVIELSYTIDSVTVARNDQQSDEKCDSVEGKKELE